MRKTLQPAISAVCVFLTCCLGVAAPAAAAEADALFRQQVAPIFQRRCLGCHNQQDRKGKFSLQTRAAALAGGESGVVIHPGNPKASYLLDLITPADGEASMPKDADPLAPKEVSLIRQWIAAGANWPDGFVLKADRVSDTDWWSLRPLAKPTVPKLTAEQAARHERRSTPSSSPGFANTVCLPARKQTDLRSSAG